MGTRARIKITAGEGRVTSPTLSLVSLQTRISKGSWR